MQDSFLSNRLHPGLPVREWNLKFFLPPSLPQTSHQLKVSGNSHWHVSCPLLFLCDTEWLKTTWIRMAWFTLTLRNKPKCLFQSKLICVPFSIRERCPGCNLNGFCSDFCHYQMTFMIWFLFWLALSLHSLSSSALPSLFCYYLSQLLCFQFSQILISIAFSEICCHLEQHPSLFEPTNQASCWLSFPSLLSWSFWMHSQVCLHCD